MYERLTIPPGLLGAVWNYRFNGQWWPRHHHVELELNVIRAGNATYLVNDRRVTVAKGELVWLHPDQEHHLVQQSADLRMWIVVFRPLSTRQAGRIPRDQPVRRVPGGRFRWLDRLCSELECDVDARSKNAGLAYVLANALRSGTDSPEPPAAHPAVLATVRAIDADPTSELAILAAAVGISADRLTRLFRRELGVTLVTWRTRSRLDAAVGLNDTGRTWLTAALAAGFGSYSQFHRAFTQHFGSAPRDWRRSSAPK